MRLLPYVMLFAQPCVLHACMPATVLMKTLHARKERSPGSHGHCLACKDRLRHVAVCEMSAFGDICAGTLPPRQAPMSWQS